MDAGGYWGSSWADTRAYDGWEPCDAIVDLEFSPNFDVDDAIVVLSIDDVNDPDLALVNAFDAWTAAGGSAANAGEGVKVAVVDSGIDAVLGLDAGGT